MTASGTSTASASTIGVLTALLEARTGQRMGSDRSWRIDTALRPLLREHRVSCIQGNYDNSIGHGLPDCQCGYTDPRDNHFARISYAYTFARTSPENPAMPHGASSCAAHS